MLVLTNGDVRHVLDGRDLEIVDAVRDAYVRHAEGHTMLPNSVFLRFPDQPSDRIIALPAYLGGKPEIAGVKWISSFPGNVDAGLERASAAIILNTLSTGRPVALIEGSVISARRTAASAALASAVLAAPAAPERVTLVGCGVINFEVLRFLRAVHPTVTDVVTHDLSPARATAFAARIAAELPDLRVRDEPDQAEALGASELVSLATTAATPYLATEAMRPGTLVLHLSLRDLLPAAILAAVNVVDDPDHVCRADTSLDLAQRQCGDRSFISATIGELLRAGGHTPRDPDRVTVYSPFGLGVLDLAVAELVRSGAELSGLGTRIDDFLPGAADRCDDAPRSSVPATQR